MGGALGQHFDEGEAAVLDLELDGLADRLFGTHPLLVVVERDVVDVDLAYDVQKRGDFIVKVTEAPHYRRHVAERERDRRAPKPAGNGVAMPALLTRSEGPGHTVGLAPRGVNAGNGFLFVAHDGDVFPSGFLPIRAGNVRTEALADVYRHAPLFRALRDPDRLEGRCGRCEFRSICGGSRSRALGLTGDPFETDPWCGYEPHSSAFARGGAA